MKQPFLAILWKGKTMRPDLSKNASIPLSTLQAWNLEFDFLSLAQYNQIIAAKSPTTLLHVRLAADTF